jgi:hypothetical protein
MHFAVRDAATVGPSTVYFNLHFADADPADESAGDSLMFFEARLLLLH